MPNGGHICCVNCTYSRLKAGKCDIWGIEVSGFLLCRAFRFSGQSHTAARKEFKMLNKLKPGFVYAIDNSVMAIGRPAPVYQVCLMPQDNHVEAVFMNLNNSDISKKLNTSFVGVTTGKTNIRFPRDIHVSVDPSAKMVELRLDKKNIIANMQSDAAAFEVWCLILKFWIKEYAGYSFMLRWDPPDKILCPHYQRFLYRVKKFSHHFGWLKLEGLEIRCLKDSLIDKGNVIKNAPGKRVAVTAFDGCPLSIRDDRENDVETKIVSYSRVKECLAKITEVDPQTIDRQLPVGIFRDKVRKERKFELFPAGKAAIDLWALGDKDNHLTLNIFELKKLQGYQKTSVGALSELFFYTMIMADVQQGAIELEAKDNQKKHLRSSKKINAYLLIFEDNLHPLLSKDIINNIMNPNNKLHFGCITYDDNLNFKKIW
jgi:hypothetical protein